jgi:hypothetical protein
MKKMSLYALLLCGICIFAACGKDGDVGPAGEQGETGAAGPQGEKGADGTTGIIYSNWLDVRYNPITGDFDGDNLLDTAAYEISIDVPKLTDEILTNGDVKVYVNLGSAATPNIVPLPFFDIFGGYSINPSYATGKITLLATHGFNTYEDEGVKIQQYRYVLIPGGTAARTAKVIDWNNYKAVKEYLQLAD